MRVDLYRCVKMKKYFFSIVFSALSIVALSANAVGQSFHDYEEVETYDDLYASIDADGVRVYTNAPQAESIATSYADEEYEYEYAYEAVPIEPTRSAHEFNSITAQTTKTVAVEPVKAKLNDGTTDLASIHALIEKYAEENNLDPSLIRSIIDQESKFDHRAISRAGARGLMQLMPATARSLGVRNSFDPEENIRAGVRHFRSLMNRFNDDLELSLAAYNAGESIVSRLGRIPDYRETREYVASVKRKYEMMENTEEEAIQATQPQPIMRYTDESGVIHLTNIRTFN